MGATRPTASFFRLLFRTAASLLILLAAVPAGAKPERIVSLNLCTDQLALKLAPREVIRSVSYLAARPDISPAAGEVGGIMLNHGRAEEVLPLEPDIVLAGRYTSRPTVFLLQRLGYRVFDQDISRSLADVRERVREVGRALERELEAEELVAAMDARLATLALPPGTRRPTAVYYQPNGYTAGDDTLVGDIIAKAGLENLGGRLGIHGHARLPLEKLLELNPQLLIVGDAKPDTPALAYEVLRHPALQALMDRSVRVTVPTRLWICGIPAVVDAVAILAEARQQLVVRDNP
jgi:ABC-type Fe3+-hydroxamate transport system, periplasmic component